MMQKYDVSIIVTVYNRDALCLRAIDSIPNIKNVEVVIVDDGSSDNISKLIEPYLSSRIRYYYKNNGGAASAKNFGANIAKGRYILFLDSDDYFISDEFFYKILSLIVGYKYDFLYSRSVLVKNSENNYNEEITPYIFSSNKLDLYDYVLKYPLNYPGKPSYVFRRELFLSVGGFLENTKWGDALYFWRVFLYNTNCKMIPNASYVYDQSMDISISRNRDDEYYERVLNSIYSAFCMLNSRLDEKKYVCNWLLVILPLAIKTKKYSIISLCIKELLLRPCQLFTSIFYVLSRRVRRG